MCKLSKLSLKTTLHAGVKRYQLKTQYGNSKKKMERSVLYGLMEGSDVIRPFV